MKSKNRLYHYLQECEDIFKRNRNEDIFRNNPSIQLIVAPHHGLIIDANPAAERFYGYSKRTLRKMNIDKIDIFQMDEIRTNLNSKIRSKNLTFESQHKLKSGEIRDVLIHSAPIRIGFETFVCYIIFDVTELKKIEEALRISEKKLLIQEQEERYKSLFDGNYSIMLLVNPETGMIEDSNLAASNYYGWSHAEICNKNIAEINTLSPDEVKAEMQKAVTENRNMFLFKHRLASGEIRDVEVYSGSIQFRNKTLLYSIVHDIVERIKTEEKLRDSEGNYRFMFAHNPQPMWIIDLDTLAFLEINSSAINHYGYSRDEFMAMTLKDILIETQIPGLLVDIELSNKLNDKSNWVVERVHKKKNGELINVQITAHNMNFHEKKATHVLVNDITELKIAENEIKAKVNLLKNLLINMEEGILLENSKREILLTNQLFCDMFGIPAPPEILVGADCSNSAEQSKSLFKNPDKFISDIKLILSNKTVKLNDELELVDSRYYERDYIPTYLNREYSGHLWKYRDVTENKKSEIALKNYKPIVELDMNSLPK